MRILLTGAAGFVGYHCAKGLLARGDRVLGFDNLNDYYDPQLKRDRLRKVENAGFEFVEGDIVDAAATEGVFQRFSPDVVLHLAAQAGVRYSLQNPRIAVESNVIGTANVLEACRKHPVRHLVFASSSSVYGANTKAPFSVNDLTDHPVSVYAATKKANEVMAHAYADLYGIPVTGLRFFTVYGPWGRPDMAYFSFTKALFEGREIEVFNRGEMERDFTYIDDIVQGVLRVLDRPAARDAHWSGEQPLAGRSRAPFRLYNIGNHSPVKLLTFIQELERLTGRTARLRMMPMAAGDVRCTYAEVSDLAEAVGFAPRTPIAEGLARFVEWYRAYYGQD